MKYMVLPMLAITVALLGGCGQAEVDSGQRFDAASATPERQIVFATRDGDTGTVKNFLDQNPDIVNEPDSGGNTLLHHAAMASQVSTAKLLIDRGADVNALNWDDFTPLGAAEDRGATQEMLSFLQGQGGVY